MRSLYKTVLTIAFLAMFQLLAAATSPSSANCSEKCGNMTISYPFGINNGCFRDGFQIACDETTGIASTIDGVEIIDISLSQAQIRVYNYISYSCVYPKGGNNRSYSSALDITDGRYRLSNTHNKFTVVGCQTLATISDPYTQNTHSTDDSDIYASGCLSLCTNKSRIVDKSPCSGVGCCQLTIPEGLSYYEINFDPGFLNNAIWDYSPCSFAFLAEDSFYSFLRSDTEGGNLYRRFEQAPVVLDWVVGNETCEEAILNKSRNYACVSLNSTCKDSQNGPGYTCYCNQGYGGNPYIDGGCSN